MPTVRALITLLCLQQASPSSEAALPGKNPEAVAEVLAGKRTEANAAWWGFDLDDSTDALQAAIDSGAKRLIVPNMKHDWVVRPIRLAGNQELIFEEGTVVAAKRGAYRSPNDTVFTARKIENLTIRGRGASAHMNKEDYIYGLALKELQMERGYGQYARGEWRSVLSLRGCRNVEVTGLTLRDSGGDGIYIDHADKDTPCRDIRIKDVICDNSYRQGMSVIGAEDLTVERCQFNNTWGTPPSAGVDLEPDSPGHTLKRIVFRDCRFEGNYSDGILVFLALMDSTSADVSVRFEDCHVTSRLGSGMRVMRAYDNGPKGLVEFVR